MIAVTVLIIAFVIEAAFAAYCIITKSNQKKVRSFVRTGAFAAFVLFALVSVIEWSFRWYALAVLLLIWATLGAWALIARKEEKKEYKRGPIMLKTIATLLLVVIALIPALIFPQSRLPKMTGEHKVATVSFTYTDPSRVETFTDTGENRNLNVQFWYPQDIEHPEDIEHPQDTHGPYPLVVFSHGAFGVKISNKSTFMELASHGYVVCSIDHPYHALFTKGASGQLVTADPSFIQEVINANKDNIYDDETEYKLMQKWLKLRTTDMNFVLDTILAQARDSGSAEVYQRIDTEKIGLIGHSLGGAASAQVARERDDINAVINLDGDLLGEYVDFVDGKSVLNKEIYPVPILSIYTDDMERLFAVIPNLDDVVAGKKITASAPNAHEIYIAGTNHMSLTDLPLYSPFLVSMINNSVNIGGGDEADKYEIIETMNDDVLAFFDVYLKGAENE